ncbi:MAG: LysR family transcriptional regulator [Roseateles sp.]|uniref:LysR family transcriptional regulator n=1 Tax=Roseateles sp. TaxID=1971397 RepID=UPI0040364739
MKTPALQWDDLRMVLAIAEHGTLSAAALQLNISHPTLSRRLQGIERRLGTRLFDRLPTALRPTEAGDAVRQLALRWRDDAAALERRIGGLDAAADGPVKLTAPDAVAEYLLPDMLASICRTHAGLQVELLVANQVLSLSQRKADIALRVTSKPDDSLTGRQVGSVAMAVYVASDLADRAAEGGGMPWVGFDAALACSGPAVWLAQHAPQGGVRLRANTLLGAARAVRAGIGCGVLPCFVGGALPGVVRLGGPLPELVQPLWMLMHRDAARLPRVARASQALADQLRLAAPRLNGDA